MIHIESFYDGGLFALMCPHVLDGRRSTYPMSSRGITPFTVILAVEDERAVLIDTGYSCDQQEIAQALETLVGNRVLSIWLTRIVEFQSICNVRPIVEQFNVDRLYGPQRATADWVDFRPGFVLDPLIYAGLVDTKVRPGDRVAVGPHGTRDLTAFAAPLVLLPTSWVYDARTKTLMTGDAFGYMTRSAETESFVITEVGDSASAEDFDAYHSNGRYWWLPAAKTDSIRREISNIFEGNDVERIVPSWGCVLEGAHVVEHHVGLLDQALAAAPRLASVGLATGRIPFGAAA